jgi:hypothetical protein
MSVETVLIELADLKINLRKPALDLSDIVRKSVFDLSASIVGLL